MIVGISGLSGSGKSAAGDVLVKNHGFVAVAFADVMKRICIEVFDFTPEQVWGDGKNEPDARYPILCRNCGCTGRSVVSPIHFGHCCSKECAYEFDDRDGIGQVLGECGGGEGDEQYLTPRKALQKLGSWGRDCYSDVWAEAALRDAKLILDKHKDYNREVGPLLGCDRDYEGVVITDVRFKNEMKAVKDAGGKLVRIVRPGYEKPQWDHPSETEQLEVPDEEFDYILENVGDLKVLELYTDRMMEALR